MEDLSLFLKGNKKTRKNTKYAATKSLCDKNGNPLLWEIKALSTVENDRIRAECMKNVPVAGKRMQYRQELDTAEYLAKMICACVVSPDLYNKELQDSYGVKTPEELIREMIDNPAEYDDFASFIQGFNGFDETMQDAVDKAKN